MRHGALSQAAAAAAAALGTLSYVGRYTDMIFKKKNKIKSTDMHLIHTFPIPVNCLSVSRGQRYPPDY